MSDFSSAGSRTALSLDAQTVVSEEEMKETHQTVLKLCLAKYDDMIQSLQLDIDRHVNDASQANDALMQTSAKITELRSRIKEAGQFGISDTLMDNNDRLDSHVKAQNEILTASIEDLKNKMHERTVQSLTVELANCKRKEQEDELEEVKRKKRKIEDYFGKVGDYIAPDTMHDN